MLRFFLNKLALIVPTLIGITICAFGFVRLLPGDPILALAGEQQRSSEATRGLIRRVTPGLSPTARRIPWGIVLFLVYVIENLGAGDTGAGIIRGVQAIGGVLGGLVTGVLARRLGPRSLIGGGYVVFGMLSLLTWNLAPFTTVLWVYAGLFIAMGIPGVTTATGEITLVQTAVPPRALGRVIAAITTLDGAAQAVGLLLGGLLADSGDIVPVLDVQASLYLVCGVIGMLAFRRTSSLP